MPVSIRSEQSRKTGGGIEVRKAKPVYRSLFTSAAVLLSPIMAQSSMEIDRTYSPPSRNWIPTRDLDAETPYEDEKLS
jgi:hypothetical protein